VKHPPILALLSLLALAAPALAADPEAPDAIAARALDEGVLSAANATAEVGLAVLKDGKVVRERRLLTRIKREGATTRALVEFRAPADVAGTRFLSIDVEGAEPEQYVYLPAFKKTKRVIGAQRGKSFMGTDFTYADLEGRDARDATWRRLPDEAVGGQECWVVEGTPKQVGEDGYTRTVVWVHKRHGLPMRMDLFGADAARPSKRFAVRRLERRGDRWLATEASMTSLDKGTETRMTLASIDFTTVIPDAELVRAALER
jgi:hypothetical protein